MLRYGTYFSASVLTTMFLKDEVVAFAELAHGDLKGHLKKRETARQERVKMQKERAAQAAQRQSATSKATEAEVPRVAISGPQQVIVIEDSDEDENELVVEEEGRDDDRMFNELVVVEDD